MPIVSQFYRELATELVAFWLWTGVQNGNRIADYLDSKPASQTQQPLYLQTALNLGAALQLIEWQKQGIHLPGLDSFPNGKVLLEKAWAHRSQPDYVLTCLKSKTSLQRLIDDLQQQHLAWGGPILGGDVLLDCANDEMIVDALVQFVRSLPNPEPTES